MITQFKNNKNSCCSVLIILIAVSGVSTQNFDCTNPKGVKGRCVILQSCSYILNIAKFYPQNQEAQYFARQSQCGYNGYNFYVCCPLTTQLTSSTQTQTQVQQQAIAKVLSPASLPKPPVCGIDVENRIYGGTTTNVFEFPWLALLKYTKPGSSTPVFSCSGTLISDRYVLTAAHCVHSKLLQRTKLIAVRLGEWNMATNPDCDDSFVNEEVCNEPVVDIGVEGVIVNEKYLPQSFNQHNDIALIRMTQKAKFSDFVKPICMPSAADILVGKSLTVTGFGRTESAFSSNKKLKVALNVVEIEKCNQVFRFEGRRVVDSQICAGGQKNLDSCRGDSGGPLMNFVTTGRDSYWVLSGIVSYGANPCGQENKPAVYTKTASYLQWIESQIKN